MNTATQTSKNVSESVNQNLKDLPTFEYTGVSLLSKNKLMKHRCLGLGLVCVGGVYINFVAALMFPPSIPPLSNIQLY